MASELAAGVGADGGRLCVRCFDGAGIVRENQPLDVLASGTTKVPALVAGCAHSVKDLARESTRAAVDELVDKLAGELRGRPSP